MNEMRMSLQSHTSTSTHNSNADMLPDKNNLKLVPGTFAPSSGDVENESEEGR